MSVDHESLVAQLAAQTLPDVAPAWLDAPLTLSADLRHSGYKLAPVDVNLFPAGWHNLCAASLPKAAAAIGEWLGARGQSPSRVLLLGEYMTRNPAYMQNLATISTMLRDAGYEVEIAVDAALPDAGVEAETLSGGKLRLQRLVRRGDRIGSASGFDPDWVLSNHDFADGVPPLLDGIVQPVAPDPRLGWHMRRKRDFFAHYNRIATAAAQRVGLDPWCLIPDTVAVGPVDFWALTGVDAVADAVDAMLERIAEAYRERGIHDRPFVVVKDEAGTFGMGVLTVDSGAAIREPNRKLRQKMQRGKGGRPITSVLVQEGIYTRDVLGDCVAEPVVMAVAGQMIGGFFRYHCSRGRAENLNAKGMVFAKLCADFSGECDGCVRDDMRYKAYGWLAELAAAAAAAEIEAATAFRAAI